MQITRGKIESAQKVVIYGPEGIGKSYFASRFPNPLFIDTEGSTKHMDVARLPDPSSWTMLLEEVKYVKANPHKCDTLIIDTADWAERLCIEHICAKGKVDGIEGFGYGKGYVYLEEEFGRFLNKLEDIIQIGINVVITAHAEIKKIEQPEEIGGYDHWQMKLEKKTMPLLKEWCDMLLFANYSVHVVNVDNQGAQKGKNKAQGGKRVMYTTHTPWWDAKNRHDLLDELPLDYDEIKHCIITRDSQPDVSPQQTTTTAPKESQISKQQMEEFEQMTSDIKAPQEEVKQEPKKIIPADWSDIERKPDPLAHLPRALADLMKSHNVSESEIQRAVAGRGYYPADTPISNYDPGFIDGVLVGAWEQVHQMVKDLESTPY